MSKQTRLWSFIESVTNTAVSYVIAVIIGHFIYRYFEVPIDLVLNLKITAVFTIASIVRDYVIRRWFNWMGTKS